MRGACVFCSFVVTALVGCSSESESGRRTDADDPSDAGTSATVAAEVDPNGGRDDVGASCFAACQNTNFTCQTKSGAATKVTEVEVSPANDGCAGTSIQSGGAPVAFTLDCAKRTACIGGQPGTTPGSCAPATFNAVSFAYTPSGESAIVCTRN